MNESGPYDIVLANGRVIDPETYLDGKMHVGIKGDRIAAVSESPLNAKKGHRCLGARTEVQVRAY